MPQSVPNLEEIGWDQAPHEVPPGIEGNDLEIGMADFGRTGGDFYRSDVAVVTIQYEDFADALTLH